MAQTGADLETREGGEGEVSEEPVATAAVPAPGIFRNRRKGYAVKNVAGALHTGTVEHTLSLGRRVKNGTFSSGLIHGQG